MDWTCTRGWLNLPVGLSMEYDIYKSSNTLRTYTQVGTRMVVLEDASTKLASMVLSLEELDIEDEDLLTKWTGSKSIKKQNR